MICYRDNPKLKLKTVKTITGETEYRKNCRLIKDKYYVMGVDCFEINKKWYAKNSKLITLDHEKQVYVLIKDTPLVYGVVGIKADDSVEFGYFTGNIYKNVNVAVPNYGHVKAFNEEILLKANYIENISDGIWTSRRQLSPKSISEMRRIISKRVYREKGYNIEDNGDEFREKIQAYENYPLKVNAAAVRFGKMLGETTYGFENETSCGYIPDHIQNKAGLVICRDGSIDNAEYVTVPMKGAKGLMNIKYFGEVLTERTTIDVKCSFHIHLGTLPESRFFLVALYVLAMKIQDEMFLMFPGYKTKWENVKRQNYNQKLRKLGIEVFAGKTKEEYTAYVNDGYYRIQKFLNDGNEADDLYNRQNHRHLRANKWERKARYYWINFMNMFFSDRKTMEFRLHHATTNAQKMTNWLFICNAVVKYAEKNAIKILSTENKISLDSILDYYAEHFKTSAGKFLSSYLKAYVKDRKEYFLNDIKKGDILSTAEQETDKTYVFSYEGVSHLF